MTNEPFSRHDFDTDVDGGYRRLHPESIKAACDVFFAKRGMRAGRWEFIDFRAEDNREAARKHQPSASRKRHKNPARKCEGCGKEFYPIFAHHRYCGRQCQQHARYVAEKAAAAKQRTARACSVCGQKFDPRNSLQVTCLHADCRKEAERRNWEDHRRRHGMTVGGCTAVCEICGAEFHSRSSHGRNLSRGCSPAHRREIQRKNTAKWHAKQSAKAAL